MKQIALGSSRQGLQLYTQTMILEQFSDVNRSRIGWSFWAEVEALTKTKIMVKSGVRFLEDWVGGGVKKDRPWCFKGKKQNVVKERRRIGLEADVESSADVESNVGVRSQLGQTPSISRNHSPSSSGLGGQNQNEQKNLQGSEGLGVRWSSWG